MGTMEAYKPNKKQSDKSRFMSDRVISPIITQDMQTRVIESIACIRGRIGSFPNVKKIAYCPKGQLITVWTYVNKHDPDTLRSIYKEEQYIMDSFEDLRFDFTVIFDPKSKAPNNFITELLK